jgi:hypothetical protein
LAAGRRGLGASGFGTSDAEVCDTDVEGRGWLAWPCFLNICAADPSAAKGLSLAVVLLVGGGGGVSVGALTLPAQEASIPASMTSPKVELTTLRGVVCLGGAGVEAEGKDGAEGEPRVAGAASPVSLL